MENDDKEEDDVYRENDHATQVVVVDEICRNVDGLLHD